MSQKSSQFKDQCQLRLTGQLDAVTIFQRLPALVMDIDVIEFCMIGTASAVAAEILNVECTIITGYQDMLP